MFCFLFSVAQAEEAKPKVLFFSALDTRYLSDTVRHWGKDRGVNGFMLAWVAQWWTPKKEMFKNLKVLKDINRKGAKYGVDSNFIKVAIGYRELPVWTDDAAWADIVNNFKNIAELVKKSGTRGIAIDTEWYNDAALFDPSAAKYKAIDKDMLRTKVYQRGKEIMTTLTKVYPDIEVIVLQEGNYHWFVSKNKGYEMWIDFYNGMASVKNKKGIVLGVERTYSLLDKASLTKEYSQINETMQKYAEDPAFWNERSSIAVGVWPVGKSYEDKSARYSAADFQSQLSYAMALSPRYVWIYGNGAAWFQLNKREVRKYTSNGAWIWMKESQTLPADPKLADYIAIIKKLNSR